MEELHNKKGVLIFIVVIVALEAIFFSASNLQIEEEYRVVKEYEERRTATLNEIDILAKAVSVHNMDTGMKIYGRKGEVTMPIASLTKIMTVTLGLNSRGVNDYVSLSKDAIKQVGDYGLLSGEIWSAYDLAKLTLISSANDGAYAFSENNTYDFLLKMNEKAKKIGMEDTYFLNVTGLDKDFDTPGAFASASDVNTMAMYGWRSYPEIFFSTTSPEISLVSASGISHTFKNTNPFVDKIPNLLFSKTGYTEIAGGNLTVIFSNKNNEKIVVTILGSTFEGRFSDMEKLVNVLYHL